MAGLTEIRGPGEDSFWTWRELMYRFLAHLGPDEVEAITAYAFMRMLESGYTTVGEFHYLHHAPDGQPYADPAELAGRIIQAASTTGIGLTLLPCFYRFGGFGGAAPTPGQRRFITDPDSFSRLLDATKRHVASLDGAVLGIAPHSLRAVSPGDLHALVQAFPGPIHIHAAEQTREVAECRAALGASPVAWLLDNASVDRRWCLIHATHMDAQETDRLARSGAVAGLCPATEADLGDGTFLAAAYLRASGRIAIGSDSNVVTDPAAELRQLENAQRLLHRARNMLASSSGAIGRFGAAGRGMQRRGSGAGATNGRARGRPARGHRCVELPASRSHRPHRGCLDRYLGVRASAQAGAARYQRGPPRRRGWPAYRG